uniref:Uncharacterized protein n=1 Tax=Tetradesmus obliquus TaxID=3088 RepID=A0A383VKT1_TETOB|eukprot:jgi/Sobl393_1/18605/SZX65342.1
MVAAGMRITYAQLLAAADRMVAGVEVWVKAQQQLGIKTDVPVAAVSICCSLDWAHITLPAADAPALLQLAMNCSNWVPATAAAQRVTAKAAAATTRGMTALLQPDVARKLLLTAAARQHTVAVHHMVNLEVMQQHINEDTLEGMLVHLLRQHGCVEVLLQLPAAAQLSTDAVLRLLLAAVKTPNALTAVHKVFSLTAARQLTTEQVDTVLRACMHEVAAAHTTWTCIAPYRVFEHVLELPAALQLTGSTVVQLLYTSIDLIDNCFTEAICRHPAAQALSREQLLHQLQITVLRSYDCTERLCTLPAAQQLDSEAVAQLLLAAAASGATRVYAIMKVLLALPAANALNAAVLVQLFRAPCFAEDNNRPGQLTTSKYACLEKLAAVPAAGTAVGLMLQEALEAKCFESMLHIVGLPAAAQLSTFEVE